MLLRIAIFTMMALGLGGFGTVTWLATRPAGPAAVMEAAASAETPPPPVHRVVLAAATALRAGSMLKPEELVSKDVSEIDPGATLDTPAERAAVAGGMMRHTLAVGETLRIADVMRPGDHGFLAAVLAPGKRAASIAVDAVSGSAGLIWPGDTVDVILSQQLDEPGLAAGRKVVAETVLSAVRVLAIDQLLALGVAPAEANGFSRTVTLEVLPADAERIAVANRLGKLSLALRAAEETQPTPSPRVLTTWGGDVSPALGAPNGGGGSVHLFSGNADGKEFRF